MNIKNIARKALEFTINRLIEIFGILISIVGLLFLISLISYSAEDPNFIFPKETEIKNLLGFYGSYISDLFFQSFGLISYLIPLTLIFSGINIFKSKDLFLIIESIFFSIIYSIFGSLFFNFFYKETFTLYINGNGGFVGNFLNQSFLSELINLNTVVAYYILVLVIFILFLISINLNFKKTHIFFKKIINLWLQYSSIRSVISA